MPEKEGYTVAWPAYSLPIDGVIITAVYTKNVYTVTWRVDGKTTNTSVSFGDPIQKHNTLPVWIREIISEMTKENSTYSYCNSKGDPATRKFLADRTNALGGAQISPEDILFFSGLGDAISTFYQYSASSGPRPPTPHTPPPRPPTPRPSRSPTASTRTTTGIRTSTTCGTR